MRSRRVSRSWARCRSLPSPSSHASSGCGRTKVEEEGVMAARRWLTIVWSTIVSMVLSDTLSLAQGVKPLAQWRFNESQGPATQDDAGGAADNIAGLYKFVRGVAGNALQFDGYTTSIQRPWQRVPPITGGFTVDAWVPLDAYPWNWVPIVDWERDMQAGFLFGIDPYGRIGLHAAVAGSWQVLSSSAKVPLKRWTHVVRTERQQLEVWHLEPTERHATDV